MQLRVDRAALMLLLGCEGTTTQRIELPEELKSKTQVILGIEQDGAVKSFEAFDPASPWLQTIVDVERTSDMRMTALGFEMVEVPMGPVVRVSDGPGARALRLDRALIRSSDVVPGVSADWGEISATQVPKFIADTRVAGAASVCNQTFDIPRAFAATFFPQTAVIRGDRVVVGGFHMRPNEPYAAAATIVPLDDPEAPLVPFDAFPEGWNRVVGYTLEGTDRLIGLALKTSGAELFEADERGAPVERWEAPEGARRISRGFDGTVWLMGGGKVWSLDGRTSTDRTNEFPADTLSVDTDGDRRISLTGTSSRGADGLTRWSHVGAWVSDGDGWQEVMTLDTVSDLWVHERPGAAVTLTTTDRAFSLENSVFRESNNYTEEHLGSLTISKSTLTDLGADRVATTGSVAYIGIWEPARASWCEPHINGLLRTEIAGTDLDHRWFVAVTNADSVNGRIRDVARIMYLRL